MSNNSSSNKGYSHEKLILPSLFLSRFATQPHGLIAGLLLIDIGNTFGCPLGVAGQIQTFSFINSVVFALLLGVLSVRFKHKLLLMMGLVFFSISATGCFLAPNFNAMLLLYSLSGLGMAMVPPMCSTIVGEHLPLERRSNAIGWIHVGAAFSYLIGAPVTSFLAGHGGWRLAFMGFMLPISLASLTIVFVGIPSAPGNPKSTMRGGNYLEGFKKILSNKSALACLLGSTLSMAAWEANLIYMASFLRQRFLIPIGLVSISLSGISMCFIFGSLLSGYLVDRFGRKSFTVLATFLLGILTLIYLNLNIFWMSISLLLLVCVFAGMRYAASDSLTLEQVPEFRGTMMSISSAAANLGSSLGAGLGGLSLLLSGYGGLGVSLGALGISGAIVYYLLTIDPTRT